MTIVITKETIDTDENANPVSRTAFFYIANNGTAYMYAAGGLPLTGDLQAILVAQEAALFAEASTNGQPATAGERALVDRLLWLAANSGAKLIFTTDIATLETAINAMVENICVASATAANKTRLKRLLMAGALLDREQVVG